MSHHRISTVTQKNTEYTERDFSQPLKPFTFLFSFERQQSLVQEQLAKLAQRERESSPTKGLDELTPAFITEKEKAVREQENAKLLVRDVFIYIQITQQIECSILK